MIWIVVAILLAAFWFVMAYQSQKRAMWTEARRLSREIQNIVVSYKSITNDERPVIEMNYLLGFLAGYLQTTLIQLGLTRETIRGQGLVPNILEDAKVGSFNGGHAIGYSVYQKMDQLASSQDPGFLRGSEHGVINSALSLNKLKAEAMSDPLVLRAFNVASDRGIDASYPTVALVHMELLFDHYALASPRLVSEPEDERDR